MKKIAVWFIKIAIAAMVMGWIIIKHKESFIENSKNFEPQYFLITVLLLLVQMGVCGLRWYSLLKMQKIDIPLKEVMLLNYKSFFLYLVIPGGMIGGDVAKVAMVSSRMPKGARLEPNFSILLDRIIGMIGLFVLAIVVVLLSFNLLLNVDLSAFKIPKSLNLVGIILFLVACASGIGISLVIFFHKYFEKNKLIQAILNKLDSWSGGMINRCQAALDLYSANWRLLILWTLITIVFGKSDSKSSHVATNKIALSITLKRSKVHPFLRYLDKKNIVHISQHSYYFSCSSFLCVEPHYLFLSA